MAIPSYALPPYRFPDHVRLERVTGVGDEYANPGSHSDHTQAGRAQRREESPLPRRHGREMSSPVTPEPESIAGVGPRRVRLGVIEVSRQNEIEVPIAVHVV